MNHQPTQTPVARQQVLQKAESICRRRGGRLTPQRRLVFEILCSSRRPMGAYEILDEMGKSVPGAKPPTVYRALGFLQDHGLVHRLESLNAFVGCLKPDHPHAVQFLICRDCGLVQELDNLRVEDTLNRVVRESGFEADGMVVEVTGRCARCIAP